MSDFKQQLKYLKQELDCNDKKKLRVALDNAIGLLASLDDERMSLWRMLDELKASEIKNHAELLKQEIHNKVMSLKALLATKVGRA